MSVSLSGVGKKSGEDVDSAHGEYLRLKRGSQLLEHAVRAWCALQERAHEQLRCEVERAREHVIPLERAEEIDGLDGVPVLMQHGGTEEAVLVPYIESVVEEGVHALGGFVEDLGHVVLVSYEPRGRDAVGELSFVMLGN